jgi:transposase
MIESGETVSGVASSLGVGRYTLYRWIKELAPGEDVGTKALDKDEREELGRLRRENKRLKLENEFAKKVEAWLAETNEEISR